MCPFLKKVKLNENEGPAILCKISRYEIEKSFMIAKSEYQRRSEPVI